MLTTIEAEIDVNGKVTLLEPIKLKRRSRAILTVLDEYSGTNGKVGEGDEMAAEESFARWMGSVNSGDANSADNERIDADLAKEYLNTHDDE